MKNFKYCLILMLAVFSSCDDFLDRTPVSNMSETDFYKTEDDFETALMSLYRTLHDVYSPSGSVSYFGELMSDNATLYLRAGNTSEYYAFRDHALKVDNSIVRSYWNTYYGSFFKINVFLERLQDKDFSRKTTFEGEARFLRGLYYFNMVRIWGGVPLVTTSLSVSESYKVARATEEQVYELIIADLAFASENLPDKPNVADVGRISNEAAQVLLGKVYLTRGDKEKARTELLKVYGKSGFSLLTDYADLWDLNNKNSAESVFEIQFKGGAGNPYSSYWFSFSPAENMGAVTTKGEGDNQVTDDLWNEYEQDDIRRDLSVFDGFYHKNGDFNPIRFAKKWVDTEAPIQSERELGDNNFIVLRYADVLLMLSEATGDAKYLNEVRQRAGLPLYGSTGYPSESYSTLDLAIEHERRVELALEFHRFFDLKRTGRAADVLKNSEKAITKPQLVLPIPLDVITQNPNVIVQNPEYQ